MRKTLLILAALCCMLALADGESPPLNWANFAHEGRVGAGVGGLLGSGMGDGKCRAPRPPQAAPPPAWAPGVD